MKQPNNTRKSLYLPIILVLTASFLTLSFVLAELAIINRKATRSNQSKVSSLGVAEAGISYYLWHLAHNSTDYTDGNLNLPASAQYGPFTHSYQDSTGHDIGTYSLLISPPTNGGTQVTVESTGTVSNTGKTRTVKAILGVPSFSQYSIVTSSEIWFGSNESSNGPVHSNVGVHFDGTNNGPVSSASTTYIPSTQFGGNDHTVQNGVWGTGGPTSQWIYPVPSVDFQSVTADFQSLKTKAQANGKYLAKSPKLGYFIQFQSDGTYKLATVNSYTFNALTTTALVSYPAPTNGVIYVEDLVWVEGTVHGHYTIAAGTLPSNPATNRDITITNNILYTAKDGTDSLGLIAQRDIKVGPKSPDMMEIDGALLSQTGRVYRPCRWNDKSPCFQANGSGQSDTYNTRTKITTYGSIACFGYWNWSWQAGINGTIQSGYINTVQTFDTHLQFSPPPSFPITGKYALLSWRELTQP